SSDEGLSHVWIHGHIGRQPPYSRNLPRLLPLRGERHKSEADSQSKGEPEQSHAAGSLAERSEAHQRAAVPVALPAQGCAPSTVKPPVDSGLWALQRPM